jgi:hypothetical protein
MRSTGSEKSPSRTLVILQIVMADRARAKAARPKANYATNYGAVIDGAAGNTEPLPQCSIVGIA